MDWSSAVVPLTVAAVGAVAVAIGAWMAARASLRGRLIDMMRDDERERRAFQVRVVSAVNALGVAMAHLTTVRVQSLRQIAADLRPQAGVSGASGVVTVNVEPDTVSPTEDARVIAATEAWRSVLAEAHVFASDGTHAAMRAFDERRAELVDAINEGTRQADLLTAIVDLEVAQGLSSELHGTHAVRIYRELQMEMLMGSSRVFYLGHVIRLRRSIKETDRRYREAISQIQARAVAREQDDIA